MTSLYCQLPGTSLPPPKVRLTGLLRAGARYEVWAGELGDERVCVKVPAFDSSTPSLYSMNHSLVAHSEAFSDGITQPFQPGVEVLGDLLEIEAGIIAATGRAWNHRSLGVGRVLAQHSGGGSDAREWSRALVLPRYDGFTLDTVEIGERASLFEHMLPALWTALCASPHGDLNEANLIIDPERSRFHLIDPGVRKTGWWAAERTPWVLRDEVWNAVFITTAANYPILYPVFGGDDARRAAISSQHQDRDEPDRDDRDLFHQDLFLDLADAEQLIRVMAKAPGQSAVTTPAANLFALLESHATAFSFGYLGVQVSHRQPAAQPNPADLLALGIMYYRALTGAEAFLGPAALLDAPAWVGIHPEVGPAGQVNLGPIPQAYERIRRALPSWIDSRVTDHGIPTAKQPLLRALLTLELQNIGQLHQLLAG
jgi:hypothetical protein